MHSVQLSVFLLYKNLAHDCVRHPINNTASLLLSSDSRCATCCATALFVPNSLGICYILKMFALNYVDVNTTTAVNDSALQAYICTVDPAGR